MHASDTRTGGRYVAGLRGLYEVEVAVTPEAAAPDKPVEQVREKLWFAARMDADTVAWMAAAASRETMREIERSK